MNAIVLVSDDIEISGTPDELIEFATFLERLSSTEGVRNIRASPSSRGKGIVRIRGRVLSGNKATIAVEGNELRIAGDPSSLLLLARSIRSFADPTRPPSAHDHSHQEPFPDHPYLSDESKPLIIVRLPT